jgi:hypothetical protein
MRKLAAAALFVAALASVAALAQSKEREVPPPGVAPEMWHPLSDRLGIALHVERAPGNRGSGEGDAITGTLMVRENGSWRPVRLSGPPAPPAFVPAR